MRHSSPRRQLFIVVAGEIEVSTSTGQARIFKSGDLLLGEDITGRTRARALNGEVLAVIVALA